MINLKLPVAWGIKVLASALIIILSTFASILLSFALPGHYDLQELVVRSALVGIMSTLYAALFLTWIWEKGGH